MGDKNRGKKTHDTFTDPFKVVDDDRSDPLGLWKGTPGAPTPPTGPTAAEMYAAQARALPSIYSPFGNQVYSGDPTNGTFRRTDSLSPEQQRLYEGAARIAEAMLGRGVPEEGFEFRGAEDPTTNRFYQAQKKLLDETFATEVERLQQRLSNQGIPLDSEAYNREEEKFRASKADAYERAAANALDAGFRQDLTTRQQNYNEIAAALGGAQLQPIGSGGSPLDVAGAQRNEQAALDRAFQSQLAGYNAGVAGDNNRMGALVTLAAAFL